MVLIVLLLLGLSSSMMMMQTHEQQSKWGVLRSAVRGSIGWNVRVQNTVERLKVMQQLKRDIQKAYANGANPKELQQIVEYYAMQDSDNRSMSLKDVPAFIEDVMKALAAVAALAKMLWPWIQAGAEYIL